MFDNHLALRNAADSPQRSRRIHRRRAVEVDLLDVGPGHVLGALPAVDEDQQARIPFAEIAGSLEQELLPVVEAHPRALVTALFGGGENYSYTFPKDIKSFVRPYMLEVYPQLERTAVEFGWGGTLAITMNRMPDFGRLSSQVFYAHGYSGHGVPIATLAGKLLAEVIDGSAERFDIMASVPSRTFPGGTLLRWPGLVAGMLFYSLRDRLG